MNEGSKSDSSTSTPVSLIEAMLASIARSEIVPTPLVSLSSVRMKVSIWSQDEAISSAT